MATHRNPLVSVIIPTYNRAKFVVESTESVLAQTYKNVEIIVVDDGSTDDTTAVLTPYKDKIRYFYQKNQGPAAARNLGIEKSVGQYLAFLDADDLWLPEKLEVQVGYLEAHPDVGMIHADFFFILEDGSINLDPNKRRPLRPNPSGYVLPELWVHNTVLTSSVVVRRNCLDVVGLFDTEVGFVEDYHLWLRIARHFPITDVHRPLCTYRRHAGNISKDRVNRNRQTLAAMEKLLRLNPEIVDEIGLDVVRRGLFDRVFTPAYHLFEQGAYRNARPYFAQALRFQPRHWPSYGYYLASWLPPPWVNGLRQLKRSFAKATKPLVQNAKNKE